MAENGVLMVDPAEVDHAVLCVVPARSGSTRIRDKNVQMVAGRTLLETAIVTARGAFGRAFVSTDSEVYAAIACSAGAEVPRLRPAHLAEAATSVDAVISDLLATWDIGEAEILVLVQPTTPFTTVEDCQRAVALVRADPGLGCALTATRASPHTGFLVIADGDRGARFALPELAQSRTQDLPPMYVPTGGVFAARIDRVRIGPLVAEPLGVVEVPPERAIDVDEPEDLDRAREQALR